MKRKLCVPSVFNELVLFLILSILFAACGTPTSDSEDSNRYPESDTDEKPVIYLYPDTTTAARVQLDYTGFLTSSYPLRKHCTRQVAAGPDGTLTDSTGRQYPDLFRG